MTRADAVSFAGDPSFPGTPARDMVLVTAGADPLEDSAGNVQVAQYLLIVGAGAVTFTLLSGQSCTFTATSGMAFPVRLDVFATHVTASAATAVYAAF